MAITAGNTYDNVNGIREDLSDSIWDVSPTETPFVSNCQRISVDNTFFEWQTDSLAAVSATTAVEGADATFSTPSDTTRLGNYTEIITKTAMISGTLEATDRAGRNREMAYQIIKRGKEIKRDMEHHAVGVNNARNAGATTPTARETASYQAWCATNTSFNATGGADPTGDGTDARTDGTQRAFTETLLAEVIDECWTSGGSPNIIMANGFNKRALNGFTGAAPSGGIQVAREQADKTVVNAVSIYESDYGVMQVVPNRFCRSRDVLVYEKEYWKVAILRPMQNKEIARTGDAEKRQVLVEWGLCAANEASSGIVADLTTS